jgi:tetratricopeptide (TPR) repeat protein
MLNLTNDREIDSRTLWQWGGLVFIVALALRMIFLIEFEQLPLFKTHVMDMLYFHTLAMQYLGGGEGASEAYFKAPLYPMFLALVYRVFGDGPWPIRLIQILMGSGTAVISFLLGLRLFGLRTGVVAGLITAICGTLILYDAQLLVPSFTIFLNMIALYLLVRATRSGRPWLYAVAGLVLGLSAIARPTVLLFAVMLAILLWLNTRKTAPTITLQKIGLFVMGVLIAVAPVTIRNYVQSGEFVLIGTYSGINLYIGNNLESDGVSASIPGVGVDWWDAGGLKPEVAQLAATDAGRDLTPAEQSSYWRDRAVSEMTGNTGFAASHMLRKLLLFVGGYELANNFDLYFVAHRTTLMNLLLWRGGIFLPWGLLLPLALAGMLLVRRWPLERQILVLFLIANLIAMLMFFVTTRYRLPMIPLIAIFASYAAVLGYRRLQQRTLVKRGVVIGSLVVLLVLAQIDFYGNTENSDAQGHHLFASIYQQQGDVVTAEKYYRQALQADPGLAIANNDLGLLMMNRGDFPAAAQLLANAAQSAPDRYLIRYNYGTALLCVGSYQAAVAEFQQVLRQVPDELDAANNLGLSWIYLGQPDSALSAYRLAITMRPEVPNSYFSVGYCFQMKRASDSALAYFRKALDVDSRYARSYYNLGLTWLEMDNADSALANFQRFLAAPPRDQQLQIEAQRMVDSLISR